MSRGAYMYVLHLLEVVVLWFKSVIGAHMKGLGNSSDFDCSPCRPDCCILQCGGGILTYKSGEKWRIKRMKAFRAASHRKSVICLEGAVLYEIMTAVIPTILVLVSHLVLVYTMAANCAGV